MVIALLVLYDLNYTKSSLQWYFDYAILVISKSYNDHRMANESKNHSRDAHCNEYRTLQQGCSAEQQSCSAERLTAFRHHIVIIAR